VLVSAYLNSSNASAHQLKKEKLESTFHSWIKTSPALDALAMSHPLIAEVSVRREELPNLGLLGLQAMGYIEAHRAPPPEWIATKRALLNRAGEHTELVDFVVLTPLGDLVTAASRQ
jgi:hexosaminidase